ncbi:hypothetical protein N509_02319, partial [Brucella abortus BC95]
MKRNIGRPIDSQESPVLCGEKISTPHGAGEFQPLHRNTVAPKVFDPHQGQVGTSGRFPQCLDV